MTTFDQEVSVEAKTFKKGKKAITIEPLSLETQRRRYSGEAGSCTIKGIADTVPATGERLQVNINDTRVFTGKINESTRPPADEEGSKLLVNITAYDGTRALRQATLTIEKGISAIDAAKDIATEVGLDLTTDFDEGAFRNLPVKDVTITQPFSGSGVEAMNLIRNCLGGVWFVDRFNVLHMDSQPPSDEFELRFVLDSDVGEQAPPYRKVVVTGAPVKDDGERCLLTPEPPCGSASLPSWKQGQPVYHFDKNSLRTEFQCEQLAESILRELAEQRRSGFVQSVGDHRLGYYDRITFTEDIPELPDDRYIVTGVSHSVDADSGFTSEVFVGSPTSDVEALG